ncbi:hypothetical protein [Actinocorallia sp. A-T 12471]|uniref:hypothetical protein n=1 Tax=Actinocorallia sp. A-T 12471 TaxID=3089813 RepID=UPI0029D0E80F|nr:hypothetical protein [Actinocorallia sp. A-T 12471]MDX6741144.1 hypothetical protein [Actinocorallia sp. A-T 12471]
MKRFAVRSAVAVGMAAGLALTPTPALASPASPGVEDVVVRQGTVSGAELIAKAARAGTPYSAAEAAAIRKAPCRWVERKSGYRKSKKGAWLFWVKVRLDWCYNGGEVVSAKAKYRSYTRNKNVYRWRGWAKKQLVHTSNWSSVTTRVKGKFYYTGDGRTYKPWATITGRRNGSAKWWSGT